MPETIAHGQVVVDGNTRGVNNALNQTVQQAEKSSRRLKASARGMLTTLRNSLVNIAQFAMRAARTIALVAAATVAAASAVTFKAIKAFSSFQKKLMEVSVIMKGSTGDIKGLGNAIISMSKAWGVSLNETIEGMYQLVSVQYEIEESFMVLNSAMQLAKAGQASVADATNLLISVLQALNLSANKAEEAADTLFQTVKVGRTRIAEMAQVAGRLLPFIQAAGLDMDTFGAILATVTRGGLQTDQAITTLRAALKSLAAPTKAAKRAYEEAGFEIFNTRDGLSSLVRVLKQFEGMSLDQVQKFVPNIARAGTGVLILSNRIDILEDSLSAMETKTGTTNQAAINMMGTLDSLTTVIRVSIDSAWIRLGQILEPLGQRVLVDLVDIVDKLTVWITKNKEVIIDTALNAYNLLRESAIKLWSAIYDNVLAGGHLTSIFKAMVSVLAFVIEHVKAIIITLLALKGIGASLKFVSLITSLNTVRTKVVDLIVLLGGAKKGSGLLVALSLLKARILGVAKAIFTSLIPALVSVLAAFWPLTVIAAVVTAAAGAITWFGKKANEARNRAGELSSETAQLVQNFRALKSKYTISFGVKADGTLSELTAQLAGITGTKVSRNLGFSKQASQDLMQLEATIKSFYKRLDAFNSEAIGSIERSWMSAKDLLSSPITEGNLGRLESIGDQLQEDIKKSKDQITILNNAHRFEYKRNQAALGAWEEEAGRVYNLELAYKKALLAVEEDDSSDNLEAMAIAWERLEYAKERLRVAQKIGKQTKEGIAAIEKERDRTEDVLEAQEAQKRVIDEIVASRREDLVQIERATEEVEKTQQAFEDYVGMATNFYGKQIKSLIKDLTDAFSRIESLAEQARTNAENFASKMEAIQRAALTSDEARAKFDKAKIKQLEDQAAKAREAGDYQREAELIQEALNRRAEYALELTREIAKVQEENPKRIAEARDREKEAISAINSKADEAKAKEKDRYNEALRRIAKEEDADKRAEKRAEAKRAWRKAVSKIEKDAAKDRAKAAQDADKVVNKLKEELSLADQRNKQRTNEIEYLKRIRELQKQNTEAQKSEAEELVKSLKAQITDLVKVLEASAGSIAEVIGKIPDSPEFKKTKEEFEKLKETLETLTGGAKTEVGDIEEAATGQRTGIFEEHAGREAVRHHHIDLNFDHAIKDFNTHALEGLKLMQESIGQTSETAIEKYNEHVRAIRNKEEETTEKTKTQLTEFLEETFGMAATNFNEFIGGLDDTMNKFKLKLSEDVNKFKDELSAAVGGGGGGVGKALGGLVPDANIGMDTVAANLTGGEYVIPRSKVNRLNSFISALERGNMPQQTGNQVSVNLNFPNVQKLDREYVRNTLIPEINKTMRLGLA